MVPWSVLAGRPKAGGKGVTTVSDVPLDEARLQKLASTLK